MRDEYLVACHLLDQSKEVYGHLTTGVRRGQGRLDETLTLTNLIVN